MSVLSDNVTASCPNDYVYPKSLKSQIAYFHFINGEITCYLRIYYLYPVYSVQYSRVVYVALINDGFQHLVDTLIYRKTD